MARRPSPHKKQQVRGLVCVIILALLAPLSAPATVMPVASGAPVAASDIALRSVPSTLSASISKPSPTIAPTGTVQVTVATSVRVHVDTLSVRLQLFSPTGHLVYQRTPEKYDVSPGAVSFQFSKSFAHLALREGRYRLVARVVADRLPPIVLRDRLYMVKPERKPVPLVVVTRFNHAPMLDPSGRFLLDPATNTQTRDEVVALSGMLSRSRSLRLTLGIPPLLLQEWRRILSGYRTIAPEGVRTVPKDAPVVATYASAVTSLKRAVGDPRLELLDVPFADPDLAGLRSIGGMPDLAVHFDRGVSVYQASLGTTPAAGTAVLGDSIPSSALPALKAERIGHMLLRPSALAVGKAATATPAAYAVAGSSIRALVIDERASALLDGPGDTSEPLLDHLFASLTSPSDGRPVTAVVHLGPGSRTDVATLEARLNDLARSGWIRFVTAEQAASGKPAATGRLRPTAYPGRPAPRGYWHDVSEARSHAYAFLDAVSERDDDAMGSVYDALVAESRCWAGPDNSWSLADRGRGFAEAALRSSRAVLGSLSVTTQTITLSGSSGKIPLSIKNASGKTLSVTVVLHSATAHFPGGSRIRATLRPADNYLTVPVDLGPGGLFDRVKVEVMSGSVALATTSVDVKASYLDRLALIGAVVLVLLGLLVYIRRKARRAQADT